MNKPLKHNLSIDNAWDSKSSIEGPFACDYCDEKFMKKRILDSHKWRRHTGLDRYCNMCDYTTKRPFELKMHTKSKHEGVKFACKQCDHKALSPGILVIVE